MATRQRPLSPHLQVYRWQIQMATSIVHRATGIILGLGALLIAAALLAMATGPEAWDCVRGLASSWFGVAFLVAFNGVEVPVQHRGDPPDMFEDQIPVVLEGKWDSSSAVPVFDSDYMLVKHGETYVAENSDRLQEAEEGGAEPVTQPAEVP